MDRNIVKKIFTGFLTIMFVVSIGILSGFTYPDNPVSAISLAYGEVDEEEQENEENGNIEEKAEEAEEDETGYWSCGECGYIYDPEKGEPEGNIEEGTEFRDLPDDWICPECGALKNEFKFKEEEELDEEELDEEELDEEEDELIAHFGHVLEMRSKHIEVLQRVVEKMISRDPMHPSIPALQHALEASSKSVAKMEEIIEEYKGFLNGTGNGNLDDEEANEEDNESKDTDDENGSDFTPPGLMKKIGKFIDEIILEDDNFSKNENKGNGKDKIKENRGKGKNK